MKNTRKDYRDTLPDITDIPWDSLSPGHHNIFQLIDGRDILVLKNKSIKVWNGYTWATPNKSHPNDFTITEHVQKAMETNFYREGWNILTGPDVESYSTGYVNPYCFKEAMLLPFDSFPINCIPNIEGIMEWQKKYKAPGIIYQVGQVTGVSKSHNFNQNVNILTGKQFK